MKTRGAGSRGVAAGLTGLFIVAALLVQISFAPRAHALFGPEPGDRCQIAGEIKKIKGKSHICAKSRTGDLRWLINTQPSEKDSALGLILRNCAQTLTSPYEVGVYPRMYLGAVVSRAVAEGAFTPKGSITDVVYQVDLDRSRKMTERFEMARTLDSKWSRIQRSWESAIDASYKRWLRGGVSFEMSLGSGEEHLAAIESVCNVASRSGAGAAKAENRDLVSWILRVTRPYSKIQ